MRTPVVTIVTPSYNQGEFIRDTIESVLSQDYPNLEYIVMDGGSTDQTASVVAEYAGRLTWISEKDRGQAHAINKGFAKARGEIVGWLNSDDLYLPGAVKRAVAAFERVPRAAAIYGEGYLMNREGQRTGRFPVEPFNLWRLNFLHDYVLQQSTFFKRTAIETVGGLDESLHFALDWDLLIRLGQRFGLHYVPEYFGVLREYPDAKTFSGGLNRVWEIRRVLERHTRLRYAPGFWTNRFDTIQRRWRGRLVDASPRWLQMPGKLANLIVYIPTAAANFLILHYSQGIHVDGWASNRMKWMLPEGSGDVVIRGILPDERPPRGSILSAMVAGREIGRWPLAPGDFEVRFHAPQHDGAFLFELRASHYRWKFSGQNLSPRKTAFLLKSAEWAGNAAVED